MKIERTANARRNIIYGMILRIYQIVLPFFMRSLIVYTLGVQYLGLNSLFTSVLQVLNLAELGVGSALVFSMYKPIVEDDTEKIRALVNLHRTYYRMIGLVVLVAGLAVTPFIPKLIKGTVPPGINLYALYLISLASTVLTYWAFAYRSSVLQAHQRLDVITRVTIITDTVRYALQIVMLLCFRNYYCYMSAVLVTQLMTNIITAAASKRLYPKYSPAGKLSKAEVREINGRFRDLFTAKFGSTVVNSADTIVISSFLGLTALAVYQNYYYIMTAVISFIGILLNSCTAGIGNSLVVESREKNYRDFRKIAFLVVWISGVCVCCFLTVYQPVMDLWMGPENMLGFGCVILLCLYFYLYTTNNFMCIYKDAAGMWHEDRFRPLVAALTNLTLNLILVRYIGIFAIILSTVISYTLVTMPWLIRNLFSIVFRTDKKDFVRQFLKGTLCVCIAAGVCYLICRFLPPTGIVTIILRIVISVTVSNLLFILLLRKDALFGEAMDLVDRLTGFRFTKIISLIKIGG